MELVHNATNARLHAPPCSLASLRIVRFLAKPLRVGDGAVKLVTGLVKLELASLRGHCRFCQKSCNLGRIHRPKTAGGVESLLKN